MDSKYIYIRESVFEDCTYFAQWEVKPSVTEFFTMDEGRTYEDAVVDFVHCKENPTEEMYTICLREGNLPIGKIYLTKINRRTDSLDITRIYIADEDNRDKGYGYDALKLMLDYAFINMHMERVTLDYMTANKKAEHLYEKIGFSREGIMRNSGKKNGKYVDLILMSMLRSEYYEKHKR
ncbi:MAG: GNAT family N-acetyltransferase [Clostridiales bacterium]|nr:GNAT family N-acetyltransferase [Clostridiales bacterium]